LNALPSQRSLYRVRSNAKIVIPEHSHNARARSKAA
jgi:hypothetical protein